MQARPNQTVVEGTVVEMRPAAGGRGVEVKLAVLKNVSAHSEDDFLQCAPGDVIELTAPDAPAVKVGDTVRAEAKLLAGPHGGRTILQSARLL